MTIGTRTSSLNSYGFAYNGMKLDNEVSGNGNSYTTLFRELDVRLGRWWAVDPKSEQMPWQSSYNSMDNNPIFNTDVLGDKIRNKYEDSKDNQSKIDNLQSKLDHTELKHKEVKKIKSEISNLKNALDIYKKIESVLNEFKSEVGEEEYNKLDKLSYKGKEVDIIISIENKPFIPEIKRGVLC